MEAWHLSVKLGFILTELAASINIHKGLLLFFLFLFSIRLLPGAALQRPPRKFDLLEIEIEGFSGGAFPKRALGLLGQVVSQAVGRAKKKKKAASATAGSGPACGAPIPPRRSPALPVWWRMLAELRDYLRMNSEPAWACGWMFTLAF